MRGVTRTYGPLHFEDLEPRRFEDLVRQVIYDFRAWRMLEATGRSGSDDGFDARGFEIVEPAEAIEVGEEDEERSPESDKDRLWLIQCKRERTISPGRLKKYLDDLPTSSTKDLYGMVFVGACEFSKDSRDAFRSWCGARGISEAHIWGRGELEDLLVQPKNDGLLFAYFGFSLRIRRRSAKTELRAKLAMKRKAERILQPHRSVLLRDPTDDRYPLPDETGQPARWRVATFFEHHPNGIMLLSRRYFAYLHDDGEQWDYIESSESPGVNDFDNPWRTIEEPVPSVDLWHGARAAWDSLPDHNKANYYLYELIRFEEILEIDEAGDVVARIPHVYLDNVTAREERGLIENLAHFGRKTALNDPAKRMKLFPDAFPEPSSEKEDSGTG